MLSLQTTIVGLPTGARFTNISVGLQTPTLLLWLYRPTVFQLCCDVRLINDRGIPLNLITNKGWSSRVEPAVRPTITSARFQNINELGTIVIGLPFHTLGQQDPSWFNSSLSLENKVLGLKEQKMLSRFLKYSIIYSVLVSNMI